MFTGSYQLGQMLTLRLVTLNPSLVPTAPDSAPIVTIYKDTVVVLAGKKLATPDPVNSVGLFYESIHLGPGYSEGDYQVRYTYLLSSVSYVVDECFTILPGGSVDGTVIAMASISRPAAEHVLIETDAGKVFERTNPTL